MSKTIADVLVALAETEIRIVKTVAITKEELAERIGELEVKIAGHEVQIAGHDRELGQVKRDFRDHKKGKNGTGSNPAPAVAPIKAVLQSRVGVYTSLGAFTASLILTVLNFFGLI